MKGLLEPKYAGEYRTIQVYIGNHTPPQPMLITYLVEKMFDSMQWDPWMFHCEFESIHPFVDGNGRIGRALYNAMLIKNGDKPVIIESKKRFEYYHKLQEYQNDQSSSV